MSSQLNDFLIVIICEHLKIREAKNFSKLIYLMFEGGSFIGSYFKMLKWILL